MSGSDPFRRDSPIRIVPRSNTPPSSTRPAPSIVETFDPLNEDLQAFRDVLARTRNTITGPLGLPTPFGPPTSFAERDANIAAAGGVVPSTAFPNVDRHDSAAAARERTTQRRLDVQQGTAVDDASSIISELLGRQRLLGEMRDEAVRNADMQTAAAYDAQIAEIDGKVAEVRSAMADYQKAVTDRNAAVEPAFQQAIATAGQIVETGTPQIHQRAQNAEASMVADLADTETELGRLAAQIGADDPDVAAEFGKLVSDFEGEYVRQIAEGEQNEERLLQATGKLGLASAKLAFASDKTKVAEHAQLVTEQLQAKIKNLLKQKTDMVKAGAAARADARRNAGYQVEPMSLDRLIGEAFNGVFESNGLDADNALLWTAEFNKLRADGVFSLSDLQDRFDEVDAAYSDAHAVWLEEVTAAKIENPDISEARLRVALPEPPAPTGFEGRRILEQMFQVYQAAQDRWQAAQTSLSDYMSLNGLGFEDNGYLESSGFLVTVEGRSSGDGLGMLLAPAADAWEQMREFAASLAEPVMLTFGDHYRSYGSQNNAYQHFLETGENQAGRSVPNILAPGTSYHGMGLALDMTQTSAVLDFMNTYGKTFGWWPIPNEPWHWEYRGRENYKWDTGVAQINPTPTTVDPGVDLLSVLERLDLPGGPGGSL